MRLNLRLGLMGLGGVRGKGGRKGSLRFFSFDAFCFEFGMVFFFWDFCFWCSSWMLVMGLVVAGALDHAVGAAMVLSSVGGLVLGVGYGLCAGLGGFWWRVWWRVEGGAVSACEWMLGQAGIGE